MPSAPPIILPDFLTEIDNEIRISGHRISLYDVLWEYNQGKTVEELTIRFPTLKRSTLHKTIAFYLDNQPAVDGYLAAYSKALGQERASGNAGPSLAELQRRLEYIRRSAQNAAQVPH